MCGGGGSAPYIPPPYQPPPPVYTASDGTEFSSLGAMQNYDKQLKTTKFESDLASAVAQAENYGRSRIQQRGLDPNSYMGLLQQEINNIKSTIPSLDPSPKGYFTDNLADTVLDRERDRYRTDYRRQLESFAKPGFERDVFSDTSDDAIIDKIYEEQYGPATDTLMRSRARGTLSDSGLNYSLNQLGTMGTTVKSKMQDMGQSVLGNYRGELSKLASGGYDRAAGFNLGDTFDPNDYRTQLDTKKNDLMSRLEGDLRSTIGGNLFDTSALLSKAGAQQGMTATGSVADALAAREKKKDEQRGLGSTGSF